jgi:hypothetical protein
MSKIENNSSKSSRLYQPKLTYFQLLAEENDSGFVVDDEETDKLDVMDQLDREVAMDMVEDNRTFKRITRKIKEPQSTSNDPVLELKELDDFDEDCLEELVKIQKEMKGRMERVLKRKRALKKEYFVKDSVKVDNDIFELELTQDAEVDDVEEEHGIDLDHEDVDSNLAPPTSEDEAAAVISNLEKGVVKKGKMEETPKMKPPTLVKFAIHNAAQANKDKYFSEADPCHRDDFALKLEIHMNKKGFNVKHK